MIKHGKQVLLFCAMAAILALSCETERDPCLEPKYVYVNAHFLVKATDTTFTDTVFANMLFNPVDNMNLFTDTGVNSRYAGNLFSFRLSPVADSCRYYLVPDSAANDKRDTITFYYTRDLRFLSNACGYTYYFNIDNVRAKYRGITDTLHSIDSIVIVDRTVKGDANTEHIKFYFFRE